MLATQFVEKVTKVMIWLGTGIAFIPAHLFRFALTFHEIRFGVL